MLLIYFYHAPLYTMYMQTLAGSIPDSVIEIFQ